ncbi:hypothetical protein F0562_003367 [Nyssa sinensis]|uniref:Uncharacterized protein n=1 Tax=Nyssa sinensis TaxID=561372 RepID=A0A5J5BVU0_9ASTE|nr:hypothetical protein F0562_003367 [Nyssa sinensis]
MGYEMARTKSCNGFSDGLGWGFDEDNAKNSDGANDKCVVMRLTAPSTLNGDYGAMVAGNVLGEDALEEASIKKQENVKLNG